MAYTLDLKSNGRIARVGSTPTLPTNRDGRLAQLVSAFA